MPRQRFADGRIIRPRTTTRELVGEGPPSLTQPGIGVHLGEETTVEVVSRRPYKIWATKTPEGRLLRVTVEMA